MRKLKLRLRNWLWAKRHVHQVYIHHDGDLQIKHQWISTGNYSHDFRKLGLRTDALYLVSNKPMDDAIKIPLYAFRRSDEHRYGKATGTLGFCAAVLKGYFGIEPSALYVKLISDPKESFILQRLSRRRLSTDTLTSNLSDKEGFNTEELFEHVGLLEGTKVRVHSQNFSDAKRLVHTSSDIDDFYESDSHNYSALGHADNFRFCGNSLKRLFNHIPSVIYFKEVKDEA